MQLIEDTPHQLVYHRNQKTRPFNLRYNGCSVYAYLLMLAALPASVTLLLAHRLPTVFVVIVLGVAGAWAAICVWQYYEAWKLQIREKWLIVDKTTRHLITRNVVNNGSITEKRYPAAQILALHPRDSINSYWLFLKYESQQEKCTSQSLLLEWWKMPAERDVVLTELQAALGLPVQPQDEAKIGEYDAAY